MRGVRYRRREWIRMREGRVGVGLEQLVGSESVACDASQGEGAVSEGEEGA